MKSLLICLFAALSSSEPASDEVVLEATGSREPSLPSLLEAPPVQGPPAPQAAPILTLRAMEASSPRVLEQVSLTDLRRTPSRYTDRSVRCAVQIAAVDSEFDPFLSRFDPVHDLCLSAWGDDQRVWHRDAFANPARHLFVDRDSTAGARLGTATPHSRFLLTVRVREVWIGEPWIEVESVVPLEPAVGEGSILHASRARTLWDAGQRELAIGELERALASPLPPPTHMALEEELSAMREDLEARPARPQRPMPPGRSTIYKLDLR